MKPKEKENLPIPSKLPKSVPSSLPSTNNYDTNQPIIYLEQLYSGKKGSKPSVEVALKWFKEVILPRRIFDPASSSFRLGELGEGGELYSVWGSSVADLSEFGVGIGLYFASVMFMLILMLILAALAIPSVLHYSSSTYSGPLQQRHLDLRVWGSAICTRQLNVTYPDGNWGLVNDCPLKYSNLRMDLISIAVLWIYIFGLNTLYQKITVRLDEAEQSAQDYSVEVMDPNPDANDPDEWKQFFSQFGTVKLITVVLDNRRLLKLLCDQRYFKHMIELESEEQPPPLEPLNNLQQPTIPPMPSTAQKEAPPTPITFPSSTGKKKNTSLFVTLLQTIGLCRDKAYWMQKLQVCSRQIEEMCQNRFAVHKIYVTFNTEDAQRQCLTDLNTGIVQSSLDEGTSIPTKYKFRETNVLRVKEPVEPSSVNWSALGYPKSWRKIEQFTSMFFVLLLILLTFYVVKVAKEQFGLYIAALTISATNTLIPYLIRYLHYIEHHLEAERDQLSLLNKLFVFRVMNTSVIIYWITPFKDILSEQNLLQIQAILIAEMVTSPLCKLIEMYPHFLKWFIAPLSLTQPKMNSYFRGTEWYLAERYSEMCKILWVALFYRVLLPTGLIITSLSLVINYWVDKYCLLRLWARTPKYGAALAKASRWHFIIIGLGALAMSGRWYSGWPYDESCKFVGKNEYYKCNKKPSQWDILYPRIETWMDDIQISILSDVRPLILGISAAALAYVVSLRIYRHIKVFFLGKYRAVGKSQNIPFDRVPDIAAYIPQIYSIFTSFPLFACDVGECEPVLASKRYNFRQGCLCSKNDFPSNLSLDEIRSKLSRCKMYNDEDEDLRDVV